LEALLATAILVGCLVVLSELAAIGRIHATTAQDGSTAARICQSKLNEILAGVASAAPVRDEPVDNVPGWRYSVEVDRPRQRGIVALRVTVSQEESASGRPVEFSLVRWIRDPKWDPTGGSVSGSELRLPPGFRGRRTR
jgi:hypothetical protein